MFSPSVLVDRYFACKQRFAFMQLISRYGIGLGCPLGFYVSKRVSLSSIRAQTAH